MRESNAAQQVRALRALRPAAQWTPAFAGVTGRDAGVTVLE